MQNEFQENLFQMSFPGYLRILTFMTSLFVLCTNVAAQRNLADYDSTLFIRDTLRPLVKRYEHLNFSAYMQPQYQVATAKGADSYAGGNFADRANNRFMLRRARVKMDYRLPGKDDEGMPAALFTFQFEVTERDANVRDVFIRLFEPSRNNLSLTAGLFARPYGYEVNLSSSFRETPERARISQTLMPSERDLGVMASYEPQKKKGAKPLVKFDVGLFNGQGKSGPAEFDSFKDLISRLVIKPLPLGQSATIGAGLSFLSGGWAQATRYKYEMGESSGTKAFVVDSSLENIGAKALRRYHGADLQLVNNYSWGKTELRGEYWFGTQPGTAASSVNPGNLPQGPTFIRPFNGGIFYFLQNLGHKKWELMVKYDWYDPNTKVSGPHLGIAGSNLNVGDIKYTTLGYGITHYFSDNLKLLGYYDRVRNEATALPGYTGDVEDDVFTLRLQMRF